MFDRLAGILGAGADMARAEAEIARRRALRLGLGVAAIVAASVLGALAFGAVAAGVVMAISPMIGLAPSLLIVGGVCLLIAASAVLMVLAGVGPLSALSVEHAREDAAEARRKLKDSVHPNREEADVEQGEGRSFASEAIKTATSNPEVVAGVVFALTSVLGPRRTFRMARLIAGAAGSSTVVSSVLNMAKSGASNGKASHAGQSASQHSRPTM